MPEETLFDGKKAKKERPRMTTAVQVLDALRLRYPSAEYALLAEVGNSTGFKCRRHADAIVMGLWPSRGLEIFGIEVKVRRSDWIKELEQPEKAEQIAQYCDRWFLAVGDSEIVKEGELPAPWGLLVPKDETTLRCSKDAERLPDVKPLDRGFLAAVLRQAQCQLTPEAEINRAFARGRDEGVKAGRDDTHWQHQRELDDLRGLRKQVDTFEATSGVSIRHAWKVGKVGEAVQMILNGTYMRERESLERFRSDLSRILESVDFTLEKIKPEATPEAQPQETVTTGVGTQNSVATEQEP